MKRFEYINLQDDADDSVNTASDAVNVDLKNNVLKRVQLDVSEQESPYLQEAIIYKKKFEIDEDNNLKAIDLNTGEEDETVFVPEFGNYDAEIVPENYIEDTIIPVVQSKRGNGDYPDKGNTAGFTIRLYPQFHFSWNIDLTGMSYVEENISDRQCLYGSNCSTSCSIATKKVTFDDIDFSSKLELNNTYNLTLEELFPENDTLPIKASSFFFSPETHLAEDFDVLLYYYEKNGSRTGKVVFFLSDNIPATDVVRNVQLELSANTVIDLSGELPAFVKKTTEMSISETWDAGVKQYQENFAWLPLPIYTRDSSDDSPITVHGLNSLFNAIKSHSDFYNTNNKSFAIGCRNVEAHFIEGGYTINSTWCANDDGTYTALSRAIDRSKSSYIMPYKVNGEGDGHDIYQERDGVTTQRYNIVLGRTLPPPNEYSSFVIPFVSLIETIQQTHAYTSGPIRFWSRCYYTIHDKKSYEGLDTITFVTRKKINGDPDYISTYPFLFRNGSFKSTSVWRLSEFSTTLDFSGQSITGLPYSYRFAYRKEKNGAFFYGNPSKEFKFVRPTADSFTSIKITLGAIGNDLELDYEVALFRKKDADAYYKLLGVWYFNHTNEFDPIIFHDNGRNLTGDILVINENTPPNKALLVVAHNNRIWYKALTKKKYEISYDDEGFPVFTDLGQTDAKNFLFYSNVLDYTFPASNFFYFEGEITGLCSQNQILYVGTKRGLYGIYGNDPFENRKVFQDEHILEKSLIGFRNSIYFATTKDGETIDKIFELNGKDLTELSYPIADLSSWSRTLFGKFFIYDKRFLVVPSSETTGIYWDLDLRGWSRYDMNDENFRWLSRWKSYYILSPEGAVIIDYSDYKQTFQIAVELEGNITYKQYRIEESDDIDLIQAEKDGTDTPILTRVLNEPIRRFKRFYGSYKKSQKFKELVLGTGKLYKLKGERLIK